MHDPMSGATPYSLGNYLDGSFSTTSDVRRFVGIPTFLKVPLLDTAENPTIGLFGVPYDGGTIRTPGSRFGPRALRDYSWRLNEFNSELGVNPYEIHRMVDCGDIILSPLSLDDAFVAIERGTRKVLQRSLVPIAIGGDHFITHPILKAISEHHGKVAVVHFDAHTDTAEEGYGQKMNHGTMFRRAIEEGFIHPNKLIQVGIRKIFFDRELDFHKEHGIELITARDLKLMGPSLRDLLKERFSRLKGDKVYVTFDIDYVDPTYAPGTGSPEVAGPSAYETLESLRALQGLDIIGFDLTEVSPPYDLRNLTSLLGVQVLYEMVSVLRPTI